jgi:hypothetical protein
MVYITLKDLASIEVTTQIGDSLYALTDDKSISVAGPTRQVPGRIKVHEWSAWTYGSPGDCTWGMLLFVGLCFLRAVCLDALTGFFSDS